MEHALVASGTEIVTVALRRVDPGAEGSVIDLVDRLGLFLLPNTAGCYTARDAVRTAHLAREAFETDWVKLEVIGDDLDVLALRQRRRVPLAARHDLPVHSDGQAAGAEPGAGRADRRRDRGVVRKDRGLAVEPDPHRATA